MAAGQVTSSYFFSWSYYLSCPRGRKQEALTNLAKLRGLEESSSRLEDELKVLLLVLAFLQLLLLYLLHLLLHPGFSSYFTFPDSRDSSRERAGGGWWSGGQGLCQKDPGQERPAPHGAPRLPLLHSVVLRLQHGQLLHGHNIPGNCLNQLISKL